MLVTCIITVVFSLGDVNFMQKEQITGIIIKENSINYLVDFSKEAKEKNYIGDYSKRIVEKKDCI